MTIMSKRRLAISAVFCMAIYQSSLFGELIKYPAAMDKSEPSLKRLNEESQLEASELLRAPSQAKAGTFATNGARRIQVEREHDGRNAILNVFEEAPVRGTVPDPITRSAPEMYDPRKAKPAGLSDESDTPDPAPPMPPTQSTDGWVWLLSGNNVDGQEAFLGTTDSAPLIFKVNKREAWRIYPHPFSPSIVAGHELNSIDTTIMGAVISGGGDDTGPHRITSNYGVIGGGLENQAGGKHDYVDSPFATVGGGRKNQATHRYSTIAGGSQNRATGLGATVAGGRENKAERPFATIVGGQENIASQDYTTIGGGYGIKATGKGASIVGGESNTGEGLFSAIGGGGNNTTRGTYSTIPGGLLNSAEGKYSLAAGQRAKALHDGTFVWSAGDDKDFESTEENQFLIGTSGNVGIGINNPGEKLTVAGNIAPDQSGAHSLGTPEHQWKEVHVEGAVHLANNATVNRNGNPALRWDESGALIIDGPIVAESFTTKDGRPPAPTHEVRAPIEKPTDRPPVAASIPKDVLRNNSTLKGDIEGTVSQTKLRDEVVAARHIQLESIGSSHISDGSITPSDLDLVLLDQRYRKNEDEDAFNNEPRPVSIPPNSIHDAQISMDAQIDPEKIRGTALTARSRILGNVEGTPEFLKLKPDTIDSSHVQNGSLRLQDIDQAEFDRRYLKPDPSSSPKETGSAQSTASAQGNVMRVEENRTSSNIVAGHSANATQPGVKGAVISGGGDPSQANRADGDFAAIGGGRGNRAATLSTIGGGDANQIAGSASVIGGGIGNQVNGSASVIGGGFTNTVNESFSAIAGGANNVAGQKFAFIGGGSFNRANGFGSMIGGGWENTAQGTYAMVPGGQNNEANGDYSFAAGHRAVANSSGSFVWADSNEAYVESTEPNQFLARASGGVVFQSASEQQVGAELKPGAAAWSISGDETLKQNTKPMDQEDVLQKVVALPIQSWNLATQDPSIRHVGPTSQDFYNAFQLGDDQKKITTSDLDGIALAAIQGLYKKLQTKSRELEEQSLQIQELRQRLMELEKQIHP